MGLQPQRVSGSYDPLSAAQLRDFIERLRFQDFADSPRSPRPFAVIAIDATRAGLDEAHQLQTFLERLDANWAHHNAVGWMDSNRLGVVLPAATRQEACDFAESLEHGNRLQPTAITIYTTDDAPADSGGPAQGFRCRAMEHAYRIATPAWKRILDLGVAALLILLLSPLMLAIAALVKLTSRGPVLFGQLRVGHGGKPFRILKFRTMRQDADAQKHLLSARNEQDGLAFKIADDPRVTRVGRLLRRTSLDELPQFINVILGQMSLVGPRPLPCSDWKPDSGWVCQRHDVAPGITCTWQVSGRSKINFEEWIRMDLQYIQSRGCLTDLGLLLRTIPAVCSQQGAS